MLRTTARIGWLAAVAALLCAGCSFDSELDEYRCEEPGSRDGNRVCSEVGFWVAVDAGRADADTDSGACSPTADTEKCEGTFADRDDDCDGVVDEKCPCRFRGERAGVCGDAVRDDRGECRQPEGYLAATDDETPQCEGRDNDCDGTADEGCEGCEPDQTRDCFPADDDLAGTGICESGTQTCSVDGTWESCRGAVGPEPERCNNGKDDDCDGTVNDGCSCNFDRTSTGVCKNGTIDSGGDCSAPSDYQAPTDDELPNCDGKDNDCDGVVDEGCACNYDGTGAGICGRAVKGPDGECREPETYVSDDDGDKGEFCDGIDNDCDGAFDDDGECSCEFTPPNASEPVSDGVCQDATINRAGNCRPPNYETSETSCGDEADNDCDGETDFEDSNCKKTALSQCQKDRECLSDKCHNDQCAHLMVVTAPADATDGDLGGLGGADTLCQNAVGDEIDGTWRAVLSDGTGHAKDRLSITSEVYNTNGDRVAREGEFWQQNHESEVKHDPSGRDVGGQQVWTGTGADGQRGGPNCNNWSSNAGFELGRVGRADQKNQQWIADGLAGCDATASLYCIDGQ